MRTHLAVSAFGVVLLLAGVAIDRYLLPGTTPAAPSSRFLDSFDWLITVMRHLNGVKPADISQLTCDGVRCEQGVYTKSYRMLCSGPDFRGYADIDIALHAIGDDIAAQVAAGGGTTTCTHIVRGSGEWVFEVGGRKGVVTILILRLNQPGPNDLRANLEILVQVAGV